MRRVTLYNLPVGANVYVRVLTFSTECGDIRSVFTTRTTYMCSVYMYMYGEQHTYAQCMDCYDVPLCRAYEHVGHTSRPVARRLPAGPHRIL